MNAVQPMPIVERERGGGGGWGGWGGGGSRIQDCTAMAVL